jgi:branched-chain amino acid transport system permease protein
MNATTKKILRRLQLTERTVALRFWIVLAAITGVLIALPWYAGFGSQRLMVEVFTVFAMAVAWNLLAGYGGMVVIGQHAFVGIGAYALFYFSNQFGWNPWWTLPLAAILSAIFALISAWPMFRLSGAYFAVATWVLAELLRIGALNSDVVGAGAGMPLTTIREFSREARNAGVYWASLAIGVSSLLIGRGLLRSRMGLALTSLRDAEPAARACGVPVGTVKLVLWVLAATITGTAGAVAYMSTLQVSPDASFGLQWTAASLFIVVLGGLGTLEGPVIGTLVYFLLREYFGQWGAWYFIGLGMLAILTMVFAPGGAWSLVTKRHAFDPLSIRRMMPRPNVQRHKS